MSDQLGGDRVDEGAAVVDEGEAVVGNAGEVFSLEGSGAESGVGGEEVEGDAFGGSEAEGDAFDAGLFGVRDSDSAVAWPIERSMEV